MLRILTSVRVLFAVSACTPLGLPTAIEAGSTENKMAEHSE